MFQVIGNTWLLFYRYSLKQHTLIQFNRLLPLNITYIQYKINHTISNHKLVLDKYLSNILTIYEFSNFFWKIFNSKTIKTCQIINVHIQTYPVGSYWFVIIKIWPILYLQCVCLCNRKIISWIDIIKSEDFFDNIFILFFYFKISLVWQFLILITWFLLFLYQLVLLLQQNICLYLLTNIIIT